MNLSMNRSLYHANGICIMSAHSLLHDFKQTTCLCSILLCTGLCVKNMFEPKVYPAPSQSGNQHVCKCSFYPWVLILSLGAPSILGCSFYPWVLILSLGAHSILGCSFYPWVLILSLGAPSILGCSFYPWVLILSLGAHSILGCSFYPGVLILS